MVAGRGPAMCSGAMVRLRTMSAERRKNPPTPIMLVLVVAARGGQCGAGGQAVVLALVLLRASELFASGCG